ncbi:ABC transporter ATP-binding protein [Ligilactobacillus equi]|uniref:ABC superfamily ATP binding cassette transporter, ABC protein n=1 Tax=Ligilactobacillus equi DSM 15833 = JCM 10991 TaxID=1423740 RepID=A0A0R1TPG6_9LACO|nr:ATP-binding cassette domain-containing protein [Ligilactobacillus equi]KRL80387.1 ABC superfamily ATP binding cassette transporter, ABC protein [Ligilactobacillus equi DSM 15833 = JCM 10991]
MSQAILTLKNIDVTVNLNTSEEKRILKNLNLTVNKGDFITLLGTNGAGKSTLFNTINGSIFPTKGQVLLANQDITNQPEVSRASQIAQVFQDPKMGTAPRMTVSENLLLAQKRGQKLGLKLRGLRQQKDYFLKIASQLPNGLDQRLDTPTGSLSGGQRQTLSFLMATLNQPQLLLLDEHTAALDPNTSRQLMELTNQVVQEKQLTCIMITHQLADALKYGNRTIVLKDGQIVLDQAGQAKKDLTEEEILTYFAD